MPSFPVGNDFLSSQSQDMSNVCPYRVTMSHGMTEADLAEHCQPTAHFHIHHS